MSTSKPVVSVITPTFNRAAFLPQAIESVLGQTFADLELLIIDDGSTDNTRQLVESYAQDKRVRYFYQKNQGQSIARNRGLQEARGEFVCFLDSDNAWMLDKLEKSVNVMQEQKGIDILYGDFVEIDEQGAELGVNRMKRHSGRVTPELLKDNFVSMNTTMTRRACFECMGGFDTSDRLAEDYGLWLRLSTRYRFFYLPAVLGYYRIMQDQISTDKERRLKANEDLLLAFLERYPESVTRAERRRGLSHFYLRRARYFASNQQIRRGCRDLLRSMKQDSCWLGPWRACGKFVLLGVKGMFRKR